MGKKLNTIEIIVFIAVLIGGVFYGINRFNEREVNHVTFINNNDDNKDNSLDSEYNYVFSFIDDNDEE